jgi:hypothetical protein
MEVVDGLASIGAGVDGGPVTVAEALLAGYFCGGGEEVAEEWGVGGCCLGEGVEMLPGDDEQVGWGLRIEVGKGDGVVVFVEALGGDGAGDDFAEDAVGHGV